MSTVKGEMRNKNSSKIKYGPFLDKGAEVHQLENWRNFFRPKRTCTEIKQLDNHLLLGNYFQFKKYSSSNFKPIFCFIEISKVTRN